MLNRFILLTMEHGENLSVLTNVSLFEKINAAFESTLRSWKTDKSDAHRLAQTHLKSQRQPKEVQSNFYLGKYISFLIVTGIVNGIWLTNSITCG